MSVASCTWFSWLEEFGTAFIIEFVPPLNLQKPPSCALCSIVVHWGQEGRKENMAGNSPKCENCQAKKLLQEPKLNGAKKVVKLAFGETKKYSVKAERIADSEWPQSSLSGCEVPVVHGR